MALTPFPTAQQTVNLCRSEKSARSTARTLKDTMDVGAVHHHQRPLMAPQQQGAGGSRQRVRCGSCGQFSHRGPACLTIGQNCNWYGINGHFTSACPAKAAGKPSIQSMTSSGSNTTSTSRHILIGNVQTSSGKARKISVKVHHRQTLTSAIIYTSPDTGAEVSVTGINVLHARA